MLDDFKMLGDHDEGLPYQAIDKCLLLKQEILTNETIQAEIPVIQKKILC